MITRVKIPKMDANMVEGMIGSWLKKEGDEIRKGEVIAELVTEKTTFDLEAPRKGILRSRIVAEKSVMPVGAVVALIGAAGDVLPDCKRENQKLLEKLKETKKSKNNLNILKKTQKVGMPEGKIRATPAARRLAKKHGLDLAKIQEKMKVERVNEEVILGYMKNNPE